MTYKNRFFNELDLSKILIIYKYYVINTDVGKNSKFNLSIK